MEQFHTTLYFILYYEDGEWYIYSSFGSDYVSIGTQKIRVSKEDVIEFMLAMDLLPKKDRPLRTIDEEDPEGAEDPERAEEKVYRDHNDEIIIDSFMRRYFLKKPRQPRVYTENSHGNTVLLYHEIWKGVEREVSECINTHLRVADVPDVKVLIDRLIPQLYSEHREACIKAGITLASTSSAA